MANRLSNPRELFSEETLFGLNHRFNQGWLISVAMDRVPKVVPYANGETIGISLLASLVPRVFWPDKPESGGKYNMERFLGWKNTGFSMNISPVGEAWVNFGAIGGIAFMFSYGLALRFFFYFLIKLTYLTPTLIFWFPLIFFYVIITESDVLTVFNHLIKTSFFVWLIFFTYSKLFGIKI